MDFYWCSWPLYWQILRSLILGFLSQNWFVITDCLNFWNKIAVVGLQLLILRNTGLWSGCTHFFPFFFPLLYRLISPFCCIGLLDWISNNEVAMSGGLQWWESKFIKTSRAAWHRGSVYASHPAAPGSILDSHKKILRNFLMLKGFFDGAA